MALHPDGIHHLAIATRDIKAQIEFFTDVLGGELQALSWMHGVAGTFHAFVELSPTCYIAFQQHPANPDERIIGGIDERAWIDPEVQALAGISDDELARFVRPAAFARRATPVLQPPPTDARPHPVHPPGVFEKMAALPDEALWHAVTNRPPVEVPAAATASAGVAAAPVR